MNFWSKGTLYGNVTVHLYLTFSFQWSVEWYYNNYVACLEAFSFFLEASCVFLGGKSRDPRCFLVLKQRPSPLRLICIGMGVSEEQLEGG